jgi:hypothetical protein
MADEIIQELWRIKDEMAKKFNYDMDALVAELQKQQQQSGRQVVNFAAEAKGKIEKIP